MREGLCEKTEAYNSLYFPDDAYSFLCCSSSSSAILREPKFSMEELMPDEAAGHPHRLEVHIHLPEISNASEANVDISSSALKVSVVGQCSLSLQLPFAVDDALSKAKWIKSKRELLLVLPKS